MFRHTFSNLRNKDYRDFPFFNVQVYQPLVPAGKDR